MAANHPGIREVVAAGAVEVLAAAAVGTVLAVTATTLTDVRPLVAAEVVATVVATEVDLTARAETLAPAGTDDHDDVHTTRQTQTARAYRANVNPTILRSPHYHGMRQSSATGWIIQLMR